MRRPLLTLGLLPLLLVACSQNPQGQATNSVQSSSASSLSSSSAHTSSSSSGKHIDVRGLLGSGVTLDLGNEAASLTLLVFENPASDFSRTFEESLVPRLQEDFVGSGNLMLRRAILPIRKYPLSVIETAALFCAREKGKDAAMLTSLFGLQHHTAENLLAKGKDLGFDKKSFAACLRSKDALAFAEAHAKLAESLSVTVVPTFFLNDEKRVGLMSYADLRGWIEGNLK